MTAGRETAARYLATAGLDGDTARDWLHGLRAETLAETAPDVQPAIRLRGTADITYDTTARRFRVHDQHCPHDSN